MLWLEETGAVMIQLVRCVGGGFRLVRTDGEIVFFANEGAAVEALLSEAQYAVYDHQGWGLTDEVCHVA